MNLKEENKLLKRILKKVLATGVCNEAEDIIENTFVKINQCLHFRIDINNKCLLCGKQLRKKGK